MISKLFETLSGTKKMDAGPMLYDPAEAKKWRQRQEGHYGKFGENLTRYRDEAEKFRNMYSRTKGLAEQRYDEGVRAYRGASQDIGRSRYYQRTADALMGDEAFYRDLAEERQKIKKGYQDTRLEQERLAAQTRRAGTSGRSVALLRDAFQEMMDSERDSLEEQTALLAKTNPVAAAKLKRDFESQMRKSYGKTVVQQGYAQDIGQDLNQIMAESNLKLKGADMLNREATINAQEFINRQNRIAGYGNMSSEALRTAGVQQNQGAGFMQAGQGYGNLAARDLRAGLTYEGMADQALTSQASIANYNVSQQDKKQMSDASARRQADMFNQQRAARGLSNAIQIAGAATGIYGAVQGANLAGAQADYLRGATALAPLATHLVTPQDQTRDINYSDRSYYGPSPPTQNQDQLLDQYINNQNLSSNVNKNAPMDWSGYQSWNTTPQQMNWIRNQNQQLQG